MNTKGLKLLARLRLRLSHLVITNSDTTFKTVYLQCVLAVRTLKQQPTSFTVQIIIYTRKTLPQKIYHISDKVSELIDSTMTKILLFSDNKLDFEIKFYLCLQMSSLYLQIEEVVP